MTRQDGWRITWRPRLAIVVAPVLVMGVLAALAPEAMGYRRWNDGCQACHGAFTDSTSTKGSVFLGGDKHDMHRAAQNMNTDCGLCHLSSDGRNPYLGLSDSDGFGGANGPGCTGCHDGRGLRRHHAANGETWCFECHSNTAPPSEDVAPAYYGSADTNVSSPCNGDATLKVGENWTTNDSVGIDNDGDNLYDGDDPDCASPVGSGRLGAGSLRVGVDAAGDLTLTWGGSCMASDEDYEVYEGVLEPLGPTRTFTSHQFVYCTTSGATTAQVTPTGDLRYYLVVPTNGVVEGSYGADSTGLERAQGASVCATRIVASCP